MRRAMSTPPSPQPASGARAAFPRSSSTATPSPSDSALYAHLEPRIGRCHLNQRLGIENDFEARVFGQGRTFFHIENWYSIHGLMRQFLRMMWLHDQGRKNARHIQVRHHTFFLKNLPVAFDGYTILHITDLHLDMAADLPDALIEVLAGVEGYDLCVLTGDFRAQTFGPYAAAIKALGRVLPFIKSPAYGVLGNHDSIRMVPALEDLGVRILLNEAVRLERGGKAVYLAGIDDPHYYRADNLEKAADGIPDHAVSILLSHSPEMYRHAAYANFDIMLSGHTHGGQICLPGRIPLMLNAKAPRAICRGPWRYQSLQGYTSVGSGVSVVDIRLNCPPEIVLHRLRRG
ncbi:metallophosphoesterase [Candidatus Methylocalor cossyra]|uniref:Metallophos domain-containing protein n=1 Tax=Candidatus Methylocalor cossyra TaxID=3108543 RepID=A0ABM9NJ43_9GAMM